jgi:hypothetical protein
VPNENHRAYSAEGNLKINILNAFLFYFEGFIAEMAYGSPKK